MNVTWTKCQGDVWCGFWNLNLNTVADGEGVYIVFRRVGLSYETLYVGQGDIDARIRSHRNDARFNSYTNTLVTWAYVSRQSDRDGAERYLADTLNPVISDVHPNVAPIWVNLPW